MTEMFGPYRVMAEVATGSLGRVYRAQHTELGRDAAIKELSPAVRGVPGQAERLRAEAATLASLSHPNIVALYDYVEEPGRTWLAEQWVDGATLAEILQRHGRLTPEQALGVVAGAVTGLAHAHDRDIVHRDISSTNILADQAGTSMLVDFGVAAPTTTGTSGPEDTVIGGLGSGSVVGTPAYLSPEAARGEPLGKASDVYSAAAVLFHLLTGAPPFAGPAAQVVGQHRDEPAPRLRDHGPDLEALVARSLSKVPTERPADAAAFLAELEQAASRRYGADWRGRASVAGLVGATAVAGGSTTVVGGTTAADTVFVDTGLAHSVTQTATRAGRPVTRIGLLAGGVVAAVVMTGGAVALTRGDDSGPTRATAAVSDAEPAASASETVTDEPTPDPVVDSAPSGRWRLVSTVVRSNNPGYAKVGQVTNRRGWVVTTRCPSAQSCGGKVTSSRGTFEFTWDGSVLTFDSGGTEVTESRCFDTETGEKMPGTHFKSTVRSSSLTLRAVGRRAEPDGTPTRLVGDVRTRVTITELRGDCTNSYAETGSPTPTVVERFVVTAR